MMNGGLGDMLEDMAILKSSLKHNSLFQQLQLLIPSQSEKALSPILKKYWPNNFPSWQISPPAMPNEHSFWVASHVLKSFLIEDNLFSNPIPVAPKPDRTKQTNLILCSWRSKIDPTETSLRISIKIHTL